MTLNNVLYDTFFSFLAAIAETLEKYKDSVEHWFLT